MLTTAYIKEFLGNEFDLVGVCPAVTPNGLSNFHEWLDAGYAGEMEYMEQRREAYSHPSHVMEGTKSVVMLGSKYAKVRPGSKADSQPAGRIARYARSEFDYHDVIHKKLKMAKRHFESIDTAARFRGVVDTAPLLEREFAQLAGLGWQGKNTMLISKTDGSWFFVSALLTNLELEYDTPFEANHCGTCRACIDACPTDAFVSPHRLDATKCISYFTIESKSLPAAEWREDIGDWLFGCDVCQEVCPWNRKTAAYLPPESDQESPLRESLSDWNLDEMHKILKISDEEFRVRFRKTPLWRSKRRGIVRNVLIVLGNLGHPDSLPFLKSALSDDDSMIRAMAVWAISQFNGEESRIALEQLAQKECDSLVLTELNALTGKNG